MIRSTVWLSTMIIACGGPVASEGEDDASTTDSDTTQPVDSTSAPLDCEASEDCPRIDDCRCANGEIWQGRVCEDGICLGRADTCDGLCEGRGGWLPNEPDCYEWFLTEAPGSEPDYYRFYVDLGCSSGVRISTSRPGDNTGGQWCISMSTCTSDSECPGLNESFLPGETWHCDEPRIGQVTGEALRLCMPEGLYLCNMW